MATELAFKNREFENAARLATNIHGRPITDDDALSTKCLDCSSFLFDLDDLDTLCKFSNLEELNIIVHAALFKFLSSFPHLKTLYIEFANERPFNCMSLASLSELEELFLAGADFFQHSIINVEALASLKNLRTLHFIDIETVDLEFLCRMPDINDFACMYVNNVSNISAIGSLSSLEYLNITDLEIDNLDFLDSLPASLNLYICACNVKTEICPSSITRFSEYDFCENMVNGEPIADLLHIFCENGPDTLEVIR